MIIIKFDGDTREVKDFSLSAKFEGCKTYISYDEYQRRIAELQDDYLIMFEKTLEQQRRIVELEAIYKMRGYGTP